jgi:hypothetical protein
LDEEFVVSWGQRLVNRTRHFDRGGTGINLDRE